MEQRTQDAVLVERGHRVERGADLVGQAFGRAIVAAAARAPLSIRAGDPRIEARDEQLDELARDLAVLTQRALDIGQAESSCGLAQITAVGAQERDFSPSEPGGEDEAVETVVLGAAVDHREERLLEES